MSLRPAVRPSALSLCEPPGWADELSLWDLTQTVLALPPRYADTLIQQREETLTKGQEFLTWNDVQKCIDTVNVQVHEEHERKKASINCILLIVFY